MTPKSNDSPLEKSSELHSCEKCDSSFTVKFRENAKWGFLCDDCFQQEQEVNK